MSALLSQINCFHIIYICRNNVTNDKNKIRSFHLIKDKSDLCKTILTTTVEIARQLCLSELKTHGRHTWRCWRRGRGARRTRGRAFTGRAWRPARPLPGVAADLAVQAVATVLEETGPVRFLPIPPCYLQGSVLATSGSGLSRSTPWRRCPPQGTAFLHPEIHFNERNVSARDMCYLKAELEVASEFVGSVPESACGGSGRPGP